VSHDWLHAVRWHPYDVLMSISFTNQARLLNQVNYVQQSTAKEIQKLNNCIWQLQYVYSIAKETKEVLPPGTFSRYGTRGWWLQVVWQEEEGTVFGTGR
jgi:hypothetical protein